MNKNTSTRNVTVLFDEFFPTWTEKVGQGEIDITSLRNFYLDLCDLLDCEPWLVFELTDARYTFHGLNVSSFLNLCHDYLTETVDTEFLTYVLSDEETYEQLVAGPFLLTVDIA